MNTVTLTTQVVGGAGTGEPVDHAAAQRVEVEEVLTSSDLGLPQSYQQGFGDGLVGGQLAYYGVYGQAPWKALSNLTLNFGLRYEIDTRREPLRT